MRRIIVVGAGITGLSAAEWLRRAGHSATLVDPLEPGDPRQTSFGNAGLVARTSMIPVATPVLVRKAPLMVFDPNSPLFLRWTYLPRLLPWLIPFIRNSTVHRLREISAALGDLVFDANEQHFALARNTGAEAFLSKGELISLFPQKADYEADTLSIEIRRRFGIEPMPLSRADLLDRDPHLGPAYTFGTLTNDYWWLSSPANYMTALFSYYRKHGGQYRNGRVADLVPGTAPMVTLEGGEVLTADRVVLAAGAWSAKLAKALGVRVKLEAERGYHLSMHAPNHMPEAPYMVTDRKFVVTPMDGFLRAAGLVEFGGVDAPAADQRLHVLRDGMKRLYPDLAFERDETWMGRRPTTPDSLPVIGESPEAPNIIHAYGGQHIGMTIGPKLGRIAADLVADKPTNMDLAPYAPDRF